MGEAERHWDPIRSERQHEAQTSAFGLARALHHPLDHGSKLQKD